MNARDKEIWEKSQQWDSSDDGRGKLKILESVEKFAELVRADALAQPTLEQQLTKAYANWDRANIEVGKAEADWDKAHVEVDIATAEVQRIKKLIKETI